MEEHPIVLFDGVCNYCNAMVNFAIRNDKKAVLRFTPLQSSTGAALSQKYHLPAGLDSVIVIDKEKVFTYSSAAFVIAKYLDWPARILSIFRFVPLFIRDPIYKWIGRNRYKWFGKKETCMIPIAEVRSRFLDQ